MTAHCKPDLEAPPALTDAELLACDAVLDCASLLSVESAALIAAAASADLAATEARLWTCRRALTMAITSWREAVPALPSDHNGNNK
jgi:hypothetical protein